LRTILTPERWQHIDELLQAALAREADERADFLAQECADEELRAEVESLIASHNSAGDFLNESAMTLAAESLAAQTQLLPADLIGHYRIVRLLGTGGMGEVYLAQDENLPRRVALKILPAYFNHQHDRLQRFRREARLAATLTHPNICVIHEIGQSDGQNFMAMEYVDGVTLRERLQQATLSIQQAIDIVSQVAQALVRAHESGVVHRDIKPENIMLSREGYVKVLDFGIAKQSSTVAAPELALTTKALVTTATTVPGMILGTTAYMSPEQVRGVDVDARSDVWSLGVMLYETLSGRSPFAGETPSDCIAAILERRTPSLRQQKPDAPLQLDSIVSKALEKDREQRYQTANEMLADLRGLKQNLSARPNVDEFSTMTVSTTINLPPETTQARIASDTNDSSALIHLAKAKRHGRWVVALAAIAVFALGFAAIVPSRLWRTRTIPATAPAMRITRLTASGNVGAIDLSLDGKYVAYSMTGDNGRESLWMKHVSNGNTVQLLSPAESTFIGTTFSPDEAFIYYVVKGREHASGVLYRLPTTGGEATRLLDSIDGPVGIAPDGSRLAFVRGPNDRTELVTTKADGSDLRVLAVKTTPESFSAEGPAWSPDGRLIACGGRTRSDGNIYTLFATDANTGAVTRLTTKSWARVYRVVWSSDGATLTFLAKEGSGGLTQVWKVQLSDGQTTRITNDLDGHGTNSLSISSDGSSLVTAKSATFSTIWVVPGTGQTTKARQVTSGADREDGSYGLSWTPDGKIVYTSTAGGFEDIWITNSDGSGQKQLTADNHVDAAPAVAPDGQYIVFKSERKGDLLNLAHLWRMNLDGSGLKQLTSGDDHIPRWSPDSRWIVYDTPENAVNHLWKVPRDGGEPISLSNLNAVWPDVSPDGKLIVCVVFDPQAQSWRMAILTFDTGAVIKTIDFKSPELRRVRWRPDGRALIYTETDNGVSNLWTQALDGGPPKQLTDFKADQIHHFDFSLDGKWMACSRGNQKSDIILIKNFR
jgi:Tol biopolymer transport system component/serine/threonine protein kinase